MVYIDTVYIFRKDNDIDYWDLAPEGTGLEGWREDEYYFDLFDEIFDDADSAPVDFTVDGYIKKDLISCLSISYIPIAFLRLSI